MLVKCKACEKEIAKGVKKCPGCGKDQRNFFSRHKIITGILALIILSVIGSAMNKPSTTTTASPTTAATAPVTAPVVTPAPTPTVAPVVTPAPTWTKVASWAGSSTKNTENFTITGSEWRIVWTCTSAPSGGIFQIYTYGKGQDLIGVAANSQGTDADTSYQHEGAGTYHLTINTTDKYTVLIEQQ